MQTSKLHPRYKSANYFSFPAIRGVQAGREFYSIMCQLKEIPRIFSFNESSQVPAKLRAQRILNKARVPEIARYVLENPDNYIFSSLTASIDTYPKFTPYGDDPNIGLLEISMEASLLINDGQHRRAAIEKVLEEDPTFGYESIPVVFFIDTGMEHSQQMFADLNRHSVRPTRSLSILYNHRDELSRKVLDLIEEIPIFKGRIDFEKSSISNRSRKLFTLSSLYTATRHIIESEDVDPESEKIEFAKIFWISLTNVVNPWYLVSQDKLLAGEFREDFTCAHGVLLDAFGRIGGWLYLNHKDKWEEKIMKLSSVDWRKDNSKLWEGKSMINGKMSKTPANVEATYNLLLEIIQKREG